MGSSGEPFEFAFNGENKNNNNKSCCFNGFKTSVQIQYPRVKNTISSLAAFLNSK